MKVWVGSKVNSSVPCFDSIGSSTNSITRGPNVPSIRQAYYSSWFSKLGNCLIGAGSFVSGEPSRPLRSTALCGKQRRLRLHQDLCPETNQSLERLARAGSRVLFLGMAFTHSPPNLLIPMKSRWNVCSRDRPPGRGSHQQECPPWGQPSTIRQVSLET